MRIGIVTLAIMAASSVPSLAQPNPFKLSNQVRGVDDGDRGFDDYRES